MTKLKQERYAFIIFFVGHNRTGKTSTAIEIVKEYKSVKGRKVVAFDPQSKFKEYADVTIYEESWEQFQDCYDTLFVLDDYRGLMAGDRLNQDFLRLLALRDERGLDFIFITHSVSLIHERISYFITHVYLYFTQGDEKSFSSKLNNVELIIKLRRFINDYVKANGKGSYPAFPHIKIDMVDDKISLINIK